MTRSIVLLTASIAVSGLIPELAFAHPPTGLVVKPDGTVVFLDTIENRIMTWKDGALQTLFSGYQVNLPHHLSLMSDGSVLVVGDNGKEPAIIDAAGRATAFFLPGVKDAPLIGLGGDPFAVAPNGEIVYYVRIRGSRIFSIDRAGKRRLLAGGVKGTKDGKGPLAGIGDLHFSRFIFDKAGDMYFTDSGTSVRRLGKDGTVITLAGSDIEGLNDGNRSNARFSGAAGLAIAPDGTIYVADYESGCVRKVSSAGTVTTVKRGMEGIAGIALMPDGRIVTSKWDDHDRAVIQMIDHRNIVSHLVGGHRSS